MLGVIDFAHVIVNFSALRGRNVSGGVVSLGDMLFEKWVHITDQVLSIKGTLHGQLVILFIFATIAKSIIILTNDRN